MSGPSSILEVPSASDAVLGEVVRRLVDAYQPLRIYLFGSAARGDAGPDSDYDLMVVVPDEAPPGQRRSRRAYEALRGLGITKDVLVTTVTGFDRQLHLKASLPSTILREGRLLYAAGSVACREHAGLAPEEPRRRASR